MTFDTNIQDLVVEIATTIKGIRMHINGNVADLSGLQTDTKTNLVLALNELHSEIAALQAGSGAISDGVTSAETTWSSQKVSDQISAAIAALVGSAPAALDTLQELAAALQDESFETSVNAALAARVRYDAAQALTEPQKAQARENIGAASASAVGATDTDYVAIFEASL